MNQCTIKILENNKIRVSIQRISIYEYLMEHKTHPTAEEVYLALSPSIPSLSRTTVYNTLKLFCKKEIAKMLLIEENEMRFDANISEHAHFKCLKCKKVFDFDWPNNIDPQNILPKNFKFDNINISIEGLCPDCQ